MTFYDFLASKALKNQYGYWQKLKRNPYKQLNLPTTAHKQVFEKSKMSSLFLKI
ncbi:hypothetical protein VN0472_00730 [Helicobacter pylori]|nr:hypothetical protein VN0472_00730 [Helicobacter pylori]